MLVSEEEVRQIENLSFPFKRGDVSLPGEGITNFGRGKNPEFLEHRPYSPGQSISDIDWKLYARTEKLFVKDREGVIRKEVFLFVDTSSSMNDEKLLWAEKFAVLVSFLSGRDGNPVRVFSFSDGLYDEGIFQEKNLWISVSQMFEEGRFYRGGRSVWNNFLDSAFEIRGKNKVVFVLSDCIGLEGHTDRLLEVSSAFEMFILVKINDERERVLNFNGTVVFVDPESGREVKVNVENVREFYQKRFREAEKKVMEAVDGVFVSFGSYQGVVEGLREVIEVVQRNF